MKITIQIECPIDNLQETFDSETDRVRLAQRIWLCCYRAAMEELGFVKWYGLVTDLGQYPSPPQHAPHPWILLFEVIISTEPMPLPKHLQPSSQISWEPKGLDYMQYGYIAYKRMYTLEMGRPSCAAICSNE